MSGTHNAAGAVGAATAGWRRFSTNTLIFAGLVALVAVLIVAAAGAVISISRVTSSADRLADRLSPSVVESQRLLTALLDQETAVRGFALAGRQEFLTPYREGVETEQQRLAQLRRLLADEPDLLSTVDHVMEVADGWHTTAAEPIIASVSAGQTPPEDVLLAGKERFDNVRVSFAQLDAELAAERAEARADLNNALRWQNATLAVALALYALAAVLLALLVRRGIGIPLSGLAAATRAVAAGDFNRDISVDGPADLRRLGRDIDSMRRRIVSELDVSVSQAAQLEQANADLIRSNGELEQFAYVASHDLQEPLRKVASFSQLLERRYGDILDERGKQYIAFAVDGAERMQILINDLLAFSRVGRVYDNSATVDLNESIDSARKNLSHRIEEAGAVIISPALPTVSGEPTLLGLLWQNLLGNAVKFAAGAERPPRVVVTATLEDGMWEFAVTDNGIGVDSQFAEKIFVIFQRLHPRGDNYGGTGIGLAMCRKIVEYHGGRIWLDTTHPGPGATFRFTLPALADNEAPPEEAQPQQAQPQETQHQETQPQETQPERTLPGQRVTEPEASEETAA